MSGSRGGVREMWLRFWPVDLLAVVIVLLVLIFAVWATNLISYLDGRQHIADSRAERQRMAICAILANIPGKVPAEIATARRVFARPHHPRDCQPIIHPARKTATPTPSGTPQPSQTVLVLITPTVRPTPTATRTATPHPHPHPSHSPHPSPSPTFCVPLITCH